MDIFAYCPLQLHYTAKATFVNLFLFNKQCEQVRHAPDKRGGCEHGYEVALKVGTVALYVAGLDIDVVDLGVPVLSMHAPFELVAKTDVYLAYRAFLEFFKLK